MLTILIHLCIFILNNPICVGERRDIMYKQLSLFDDPSTEVCPGVPPSLSPTQTVGGSSLFKTCTKCKEIKLRSEFHKCKSKSDGLQSKCIKCNNKVSTAWALNNKEKRRVIDKRSYLANLQKIYAKSKRWHEANREKRTANARRWHKNNPEKSRAYCQNRRAMRENAAGYNYTNFFHIKARWEMYGGKCWICGKPAEHTDHVIPLNVGGSHWPSNLRPACAKCNTSRPKDGRDLPTRKTA